ncbi:MAG: hypothetical protein II652_04755 [Bacteroidales bacterium]|nr:hypothetical protein [Bacteroidales bacterium]
MKKILVAFIILAASLNIKAQVVFKPGYIVDNQGVKTECQIKDYGWLFSPERVVYKLSEESDEVTATVRDLSAFGVQGADYIRREVSVDISPISLDNLSVNRMPEYEKRTVFLKVLHQGEVSLYEYYKDHPLYFYDMGGGVIPLVYKKYQESKNGTIRTNAGFREQIKQFPGAANLSRSKLESLDYTASDLLLLFGEAPEPVEKGRDMDFAVLVGGGISSFDYKVIKSGIGHCEYLGFELESYLPFAARRFSVAVQPSLQFAYGEIEYRKYSGAMEKNQIKVFDLSVPLTVRYNIYLNQKSRLMIDALVGYDFPLNRGCFLLNKDYKYVGSFRIGGGLGYRYGHLRAELRYTAGSAHLSRFPAAMGNWMRLASLNLAYCF